MPKAKAKKKPTAVKLEATAPPDKATMVVSLYDGTRQPIELGDFLIRVFDGFQNQLFDNDRPAPTTVFSLPFHDNLQDNYRVLASADDFTGAGFSPVKLSPQAVAPVDLLLLPHGADFKFQTWADVKTTDPVIAAFLAVGGTDAEAQAHYDDLRQNKPAALASLLNLATAMKDIHLPSKTPLDYFREILWDESLSSGSFFRVRGQGNSGSGAARGNRG